MSNAIDISDDTFDSEVLESDKPVLIDFWAESVSYTHLTLPTTVSV